MTLNKSALILVDCENDFLSSGGKLYEAVKPSLEENNVVKNLNAIIDEARRNGILIIFSKIVFNEGYPELGDNPYGILTAIKDSGAFVRGSWGSQVADSLNSEESDIVIEKSQMCAFKNTNLDSVLKGKGINTLYFAGLVTDLCIETSVRSSYDMGYETYAIEDCMASIDHDVHKRTVEDNFPLFSKVIDKNAFLDKMAKIKDVA